MPGCSQPNASGSDIDTQLIIDLVNARTDTYGPDGEEILSMLQLLRCLFYDDSAMFQTLTRNPHTQVSMLIP